MSLQNSACNVYTASDDISKAFTAVYSQRGNGGEGLSIEYLCQLMSQQKGWESGGRKVAIIEVPL